MRLIEGDQVVMRGTVVKTPDGSLWIRFRSPCGDKTIVAYWEDVKLEDQ